MSGRRRVAIQKGGRVSARGKKGLRSPRTLDLTVAQKPIQFHVAQNQLGQATLPLIPVCPSGGSWSCAAHDQRNHICSRGGELTQVQRGESLAVEVQGDGTWANVVETQFAEVRQLLKLAR